VMQIASTNLTSSPRDPGSSRAAWPARRMSGAGQDTAALWRATLASALRDPRERAAERDNRQAAARTLATPTYRLAGNLENLELGYRLPS
jgi:hypothetical protein